MNRSKLVRLGFAAAFACAAALASAQQALEIIALRHRTAEQVLPALQPLLEPGGSLSGQRGQLFVRASPGNVAEIKRALEAIDRPLRRLQISVRFDDALHAESRGIEAGGTVGSRGARVELRAHDSRSAAAERVDQRLQVLEGGRATIFTGQSRPLRQRQLIQTPGGVVAQETIVTHDAVTGFEVVPRLSGSNVFLEIAPQREAHGVQQQVATAVSARLGEWVELGAVAAAAPGAREARRVWVKVEELPN